MKILIYSLIAFTTVILSGYLSNDIHRNLLIGVSGGAILLVIDQIVTNAKWLLYCYWSVRYFGKTVRLSISYLYRIKIDEDYFLIKGTRIKDRYQPVGGVYKRFDSSEKFFSSISALDDDLFPVDESSKNDLRIRIKGRHLLSFIKWFEKGIDREVCPCREFQEELLATNIISSNTFPYLLTGLIRRHVSKVKWSAYVQSYELLIADIIKPIFNENQLDEFRKLKAIESKDYIFASEDQIKRLGVIPKQNSKANIAETANWLL
jgi:hypothetical protein